MTSRKLLDRDPAVPMKMALWDDLAKFARLRAGRSQMKPIGLIVHACSTLARKIGNQDPTAMQIIIALAAMGEENGETLASAYETVGERAGEKNAAMIATLFGEIARAAYEKKHNLAIINACLLVAELVTYEEACELVVLSAKALVEHEATLKTANAPTSIAYPETVLSSIDAIYLEDADGWIAPSMDRHASKLEELVQRGLMVQSQHHFKISDKGREALDEHRKAASKAAEKEGKP